MTTLDVSHVSTRRARARRIPHLPLALTLAWLTLALAALWALFPSWFTAFDPLTGTPGAQRLAPGGEHWLGTDQLGRDLCARLVWGASQTLSGALAAVALGLGLGTLYGVIAGAAGGRTEQWLMRLVDVLLASRAFCWRCCVIIAAGVRNGERGAGRRRNVWSQALRASPAPKWCGCATAIMSRRRAPAAARSSAFSGGTFCRIR